MRRPLREKGLQVPAGPLARGVAIVVFANLLFLALLVVAPAGPHVAAARVRKAFETGEIETNASLPLDRRRGSFQYNDCLILQMLANEDSSPFARAVAPKVYVKGPSWRPCEVLRDLVVNRVDPETLILKRYSRYWHGCSAVTGFALRWMELRRLRSLLAGAVWLGIGALALAAYRSGFRVRRAGLVIALAAATVWGVQYYSPGLSQGPGDALLLFALATLAAWPGMTARLGTIVPYAAAFGAAVVFFEMFTGQLPTAVAWLAVLTLAAARDERRQGAISAPRAVLAAVTAFGLAAAATVLVKQALALLLVGPEAGQGFLEHLDRYMSLPEANGRWPGFLLPFVRLAQYSGALTFGNRAAGYVLILATALAWLAAAIRYWRQRGSDQGRDLLVLFGAALVSMFWILLLPNHTYIHAYLMVRLLVVPLSLAALALCWELGSVQKS